MKSWLLINNLLICGISKSSRTQWIYCQVIYSLWDPSEVKGATQEARKWGYSPKTCFKLIDHHIISYKQSRNVKTLKNLRAVHKLCRYKIIYCITVLRKSKALLRRPELNSSKWGNGLKITLCSPLEDIYQ